MDPERFARIRELFVAARQRPEGERRAWLEAECAGDDELLREVQALLDQPARSGTILQPGGFLDSTSEDLRLLAGFAERKAPERIGPYRILGVLGTGGMGLVYRAEQTQPIRREVALKLMRGDLWAEGADVHVKAEAQTLAMLSHPNIAQIYDVGLDDQGNPFLVMELVRGEPIIDFCDRKELPSRERLAIFRQVCHAVQHAHQKGIIHRDLKPSNVLIAEQEGTPIPKIIDFGIAKMTEDPELELNRRTRTGRLVGTLEYMSPEQVRGARELIDTRSDVYALGVLLYQLLAGRLPYDFDSPSVVDIARAIGEEDPHPLRTPTGTRFEADLETIVRVALEKDPERRYQSAAALADDIGRWFDSQPIQARPPTTLYQIRKLIGRHRAQVRAIALLLVVSIATVLYLFDRQSDARRNAEIQAQKAAWTRDFLVGILTSASPKSRASAYTVREALDQAASKVDRLHGQEPDVLATIHDAIGWAYMGIGEYDAADTHLMRSLEIRKTIYPEDNLEIARAELAIAKNIESGLDMGRLSEADKLAESAIESMLRNHECESLEVAAAHYVLASIRFRRHRFAEAESLAQVCYSVRREHLGERDSLTVQALIGYALASARHRPESEESERRLERSVKLCREVFGERSYRAGLSLMNLALLYVNAGRYAEAEAKNREARAIYSEVLGESHPNTQTACWWLIRSVIYQDPARAEPELRRYLKMAEEVPKQDLWRVTYAVIALGYSLDAQGRSAEAEQKLLEGIELHELHPVRAEAYLDVCISAGEEHYERLGKPEEAARWRERIEAALGAPAQP
jgi:serine/threonine protein kinase